MTRSKTARRMPARLGQPVPLSTDAGNAPLPTREQLLAAQVHGGQLTAEQLQQLQQTMSIDQARALVAAHEQGPQGEPIDLEALAMAVSQHLDSGRSGVDPYAAARKFDTFSSCVLALRAGDPDAVAAFALTDQVTTNNAGVLQPGWLNEVKGLVAWSARAISALGGPAPLPENGMSVNWPYYNGTLTSLVGLQATEKTEVTSARVDLLLGTAPLKTYAGASDVSWQLIERSDPGYADAYLRIMTAAYNLVTDAAFVGVPAGGSGLIGMANAATQEIVLDLVLAGTTADAIRAAVFDASVRVEDVTGAPASVLLAATDVFKALGGKAGLLPAAYNTNAGSGVSDAAGLRVEISGLSVVRVPALPNGYMVATNPQAARWHGSGPLFASAPEVAKLGQDTAVWGMGAPGIYLPKGICRIVKVATA